MKNFRKLNCPHCGNCKYFVRDYEDTYCTHPSNRDEYINGHYVNIGDDIVIPSEDTVCDQWEAEK